MDLNTLKTFYTLALTRNFSRCAEKLYVTQSAVSHAIKRLERSLDKMLIDRNRKVFALTPAGHTLLQSCRVIFHEVEKARVQLLAAENQPEVIRLGSPVEFGLSIVLKQIKTFYEHHPNIHIDFHLSHDLLDPLLDDRLDIIIDCRPHTSRVLKVIPLFREEYAVIASADYVAQHRILSISDLSRCNVLSLDKQMAWWGNFINALPSDRLCAFNQVTQIDHIRGIIHAALDGLGVGFVPRYTVLRELEKGLLVELFPELDILKDQINIYIKRECAILEKNRALIAHIKRFRLQ